MASRVEDITITYEEEGVDIIKELDKKILSHGAWATLIFRYQQWDRSKTAYSPDRYSIRRYKKKDGNYIQQSKFNISSKDQAEKIVEALQSWIALPSE
ncbi:MAG: hypothetical protein JW795_03505 [Chitinivibrionales bacterium]|nr:hypothetical protein [Chitinivibrionales bacterium]